MNRTLAFTLVILLTFLKSHAQTHFGIEGGGVFSNLPGSSVSSVGSLSSPKRDPVLSFQGGIWSDIKASDYVNFQPHLLWAQKGATLKGEPTGEGEAHIRLNYLELPLNLMYRLPFEYDDLFIGGGPYGALSLDNQKELHLAPLDAGFNVTLSYQCSFGLTFSARYSRGLVNIMNGNGDGHLQNQYAGITLGYLFHYNTRD